MTLRHGTQPQSDQCMSMELTPSTKILISLSTKNSAGFVMKVWPAVIGAALYGISGLLHWIREFFDCSG